MTSKCVEFEDYSTTSKVYDATRVPVGVESLINLLKEEKCESLLDLGCGTGNYLAPVAPHVQKVMGIDYNTGMLEQCAAKVEKLGLKHVELQQGSILERLPFDDNSFDAVMINQVLHHVDTNGNFSGSATAVVEAFRVLKSGGLLWISYSDPQQTLQGYWYNKLIPRVATEYAKRQVPTQHLEGLFATAGFQRIESVVDHEPQQGHAYFNLTGPLTVEFRNGDSQWSMATPAEIAAAEGEVRCALKARKIGQLFQEYDEGRHEVGQTTWTYGRKP
jgi:ubiquinone/menaquinone biosynthesis C-methylase UbiE